MLWWRYFAVLWRKHVLHQAFQKKMGQESPVRLRYPVGVLPCRETRQGWFTQSTALVFRQGTPMAAQSSSKHQLSGSENAHPAKGFLWKERLDVLTSNMSVFSPSRGTLQPLKLKLITIETETHTWNKTLPSPIFAWQRIPHGQIIRNLDFPEKNRNFPYSLLPFEGKKLIRWIICVHHVVMRLSPKRMTNFLWIDFQSKTPWKMNKKWCALEKNFPSN